MTKKIAIISFSSSKSREYIFSLPYFSTIQKFFKQYDCALVFPEGLFKPDENNLDNDDIVVSSFHDALMDDNIIGIIALQGGRNANRLLSKIDYSLFKKYWKPVVGFSDTTVILNALTTCTGMVTYHGPLFFDYGFHDSSVLASQFCAVFLNHNHQSLLPLGVIADTVWRDKNFTGEGNIHHSENRVLYNQDTASGTLLGGNLVSLCTLQGTSYFVPYFEKIVLMIEDDEEETVASYYRSMIQLSQQPWFSKVQGILFGKIASGSSYNYGDILGICKSLGLNDILLGINFDFGHIYPQSFFPIGSSVTVSKSSLVFSNQ